MATTDTAAPKESSSQPQCKTNDMSIQVATVNGSGSQTANTILLRSIFQMGIPVSGKNIFPSNIAGLPTWYTIRANHQGYIARKNEIDFLVAMNRETAQEDVMNLPAGAGVVYDEPLQLNELRSDLVFHPVPFDKIVATVCPDARLRRLVRNMLYVGALAHLLDIDTGEMEKALHKQLGSKPKALALNWDAIQAGVAYAAGKLLQIGALPSGKNGQNHREDPDRRKQCCRHRLSVRGGYGAFLVSHHSLLFAGRIPDRAFEPVPHRSGDGEGHFRGGAGRR